MNGEEIKFACHQQYEIISNAQEQLGELRAECKHGKTYEGEYEWRVGSTYMAEICEYCGEVIRNLDMVKLVSQLTETKS